MTAASRTLPDFLGIGAAKSGTSAIFQYMRGHPQIFMPSKELRFFAYDDGAEAEDRTSRFGKHHFAIRTLEEYEALFAESAPGQVRGEISPIYLESRTAPQKIRETIPDVKLIASLRNPVQRAFSGYLMQVRAGREHRAMEDSFDADVHHVQAGLYHAQVKRYIEIFPREQLFIFPYEEFAQDNAATMRRIFTFLDVDPDFRPDLERRHNEGSYPRSRLVNSLIENRLTRDYLRPAMPKWARGMARSLKKKNLGRAPHLSPEIHRKLLGIYRTDIERLEDLTALDLSSWKKEPA